VLRIKWRSIQLLSLKLIEHLDVRWQLLRLSLGNIDMRLSDFALTFMSYHLNFIRLFAQNCALIELVHFLYLLVEYAKLI
jgi:hypothetical protein